MVIDRPSRLRRLLQRRDIGVNQRFGKQRSLHIGENGNHNADQNENELEPVVLHHESHESSKHFAGILHLRARHASPIPGARPAHHLCIFFRHIYTSLRQNPRMRFCRMRQPVRQHLCCCLKVLHQQDFQTYTPLRQNPRMRFCRMRQPVRQHRCCCLKVLHQQDFQTFHSLLSKSALSPPAPVCDS